MAASAFFMSLLLIEVSALRLDVLVAAFPEAGFFQVVGVSLKP